MIRDLLSKLTRRILGERIAQALSQRATMFEERTLVAMLAVVIGLFVFAKIAEEVFEGGIRGFDSAVLLALRVPGNPSDPIGPSWFEEMMRDLTALGSTGVIALVVITVIGFLALTGKRHSALLILISVLGGTLLSTMLKMGFARPRPDLVPHGADVYTASFPSGHAMLSAVIYLTLGVLLARTQSELRVKIYVIATAFLLTAIVGISRIYLGVHWPTDVLAGWALGTAWALGCWLVMLWLQTEGQVEIPADDETTNDRPL